MDYYEMSINLIDICECLSNFVYHSDLDSTFVFAFSGAVQQI